MSKVNKLKDLDKHLGILEGQETVQHRVYEIEETETKVSKQETTKAYLGVKIDFMEANIAKQQAEVDDLKAMYAQMTKE